MTIKVRSIHTTCDNTVTTPFKQNVTISGFGDVAGCVIISGYSTLDGTLESHRSCGMGAASFDGTDKQWSWNSSAFDAANPNSRTGVMGDETKAILIPAISASTAVDVTGSVAAITDGIEITWSAQPAAAYRMNIILFGGTDMKCEAGSVASDSTALDTELTVTCTDMNVEPECLILGSSHTTFTNSFTAHANHSIGFAKGPNASIAQACWGFNSQNARSAADRHIQVLSSTRCLDVPTYTGSTTDTGWEATDFGVNGTPLGTFGLTKRVSGNNTNFGWFAFSTQGTASIDISTTNFPFGSTGSKSYTTPGFKPQFAMLLPTTETAVGYDAAGLSSAGQGVSSIDATGLAEGTYQSGEQEVAPSDTHCWFESNFLSMQHNPGDAGGGYHYNATFTSFDATGFTYNVTDRWTGASPVGDVPIPVLAIEEVSSSISNIVHTVVRSI